MAVEEVVAVVEVVVVPVGSRLVAMAFGAGRVPSRAAPRGVESRFLALALPTSAQRRRRA